jgi:hypothetical protein
MAHDKSVASRQFMLPNVVSSSKGKISDCRMMPSLMFALSVDAVIIDGSIIRASLLVGICCRPSELACGVICFNAAVPDDLFRRWRSETRSVS